VRVGRLSTRLDDTTWVDELPEAPGLHGRGVLWWVMRRQRDSILVGVLAALIWMGSIALIPAALGRAVEDGIADNDGRALVLWSAVIGLLAILESVSGAVRHRHAYLLYQRSALAVANVLARRALAPRGGLERAVPAGDLVTRATSDARAVGEPVDLLCRGIASAVVFAGVTVALFAIDPALGLLLAGGLPLCLLAMIPLWRPLTRRSAARQDLLGIASETAREAVVALPAMKGLSLEQHVLDRYRERTRAVRSAALDVARLEAGWEMLRVIVPGLFLAATALIGGRLALSGDITAGELVTAFAYAAFVVEPVRTFGQIGEVWAQGGASAERVAAALNAPFAIGSEDAAAQVTAQADRTGEVRLHDVHAGVLAGVSLEVSAGSFLAVASDLQAGAAMLGALLAREREPGDGVVEIEGRSICDVPLAELRSRVLSVGRDAFLFAGTLRANIDPGRTLEDERVHEYLRAAAAADISRDGGLERTVAERGASVSGGERQRLALARALAAAPAVLVLEEPTNVLDAVTAQLVAERLRAARRGMTTIVLTTRPELLAAADDVVYLAGGRVVDRGPHADLLSRHPGYRELVLGQEPA
jgi:putative ABC transport system ATP-binding protein